MDNLSLSEDELMRLVYPPILKDGFASTYYTPEKLTTVGIDELGESLARHHMGRSMQRHSNYWHAVKREFRTLICEDDKKYSDLKKRISSAEARTETAVTSLIAAGIASHLGLAAGALVPFCALLLIVLVRTGKNAICAELPLDIPVIEPKKKKKK